MSTTQAQPDEFRTLIPARIDRLPWTGFHTTLMFALGVSWFINGLEIQLASQGAVILLRPDTLHLTAASVGLLPSVYLIGEVVGAIVFSRLSDTLGRRKLFLITLGFFIVGNVASAFAPNFEILLICRFIAGLGVGGEQVAIVSAIDEIIPAKFRARANIAIGATVWVGVMVGALAGYVLYNPDIVAYNVGWRIAYAIGPILCIPVLFLRHSLPESPRWLMTHGRGHEAERVIDEIEARVQKHGRVLPAIPEDRAINIQTHPKKIGYGTVLRVMFVQYPKRSFAAIAVLTTQGFLYNAIFFTFALVLAGFYHIPPSVISAYIFIFAAGNALGALLGPLFDTVGRKKMILVSYCGSALVLTITALLFQANAVNALTLTLLWWLCFFIASAGAGASYVIASETFPIEVRASALAIFFVIAQGIGAISPVLFGYLIGDGTNRGPLTVGYLVAAGLVAAGGLIMWFFGTEAAGKSLEDVAPRLRPVRSQWRSRASSSSKRHRSSQRVPAAGNVHACPYSRYRNAEPNGGREYDDNYQLTGAVPRVEAVVALTDHEGRVLTSSRSPRAHVGQ